MSRQSYTIPIKNNQDTNDSNISESNKMVDTDDSKLVICEIDIKSELSKEKNVEEVADDGRAGSQRENRLTSIIDQLRCASKLKGYTQRGDNQTLNSNNGYTQRGDNQTLNSNNGEAGGGGARRCVRDATPAQHALPALPTLPAPPAHVKTERLSPHDNRSSGSRSRSVTPSTSSSRGSPHAHTPAASAAATAPAPAPPLAPRNYSDIMRSLAARYNTQHPSEYFHRVNNGFVPVEPRPLPQSEAAEVPLSGLFGKFINQQGAGLPRLPAFPVMLDMSATKTLFAIARTKERNGRIRRKRVRPSKSGTDHSPLDLSAATENATKRARMSMSPSTRSECDERDRGSNDGQSECLCAEARARLRSMTIDEVGDFVNSIDICAEYAPKFREQRIDGAGLPLLTEDHLTGMLQMKLGPALKLRAILASKLEPCAGCLATNGPSTGPRINGSLKSEPRSNTTSPS